MATKTGYFGEWDSYRLGWWKYKWRSQIKTVSGQSLTVHDYEEQQQACAYYTVSNALKLDANEYPTRVKFSNYGHYSGGAGWYCSDDAQSYVEPGDVSSVSVYLCYGSGQNRYELKKLTDLNITCPQTITPETWYTVSNGKSLAGKTLEIYVEGDRNIWFYGECKVTIETNVHAINWTNPGLSFSQDEYELTVTRSGSATDTWGETISYQLYVDGVNKGTFSGTTKTLTLTDADLEVEHTYRLVAVSSITSTGVTAKFTPAQVHKTLGYWNGTTWVECIPYYYTGSAWQEVWPYYWNGTQWVLCSQK